jgi:hypothetical protein
VRSSCLVLLFACHGAVDPSVDPPRGDTPDPSTDTPPGDPPAAGMWDGVELWDAYGTLRKAAIQLAGRPPTDAEIAAVDAGGLEALDPLLDGMMDEPAFEERVREIWGDVLLTDGLRANNALGSAARIADGTLHPVGVDWWGGEDWAWRYWPRGEGIRLVEALAREPLEFVVHAVRDDASMATILTADHRLVNAWSARFFGVPYKGFPAGTPFSQIPDPLDWEEARVPLVNEDDGDGEYAGILTTSAWLLRYPSSPTNFNRKRARFTYKVFLDFDIMKAAPRIDAAAVDLSAWPTRNNPQCTGCHAQIDPLAGAYANWDECGWDARTFYRQPAPGEVRGEDKSNACDVHGWVDPTHMFPPGVGPGEAKEIAPADLPRSLEVLAADIVGQRAFARSVVTIFWTGLMGRPLLSTPPAPEAALEQARAAEQAELSRLTDLLEADGLRPRRLIREIVRSPWFRARAAAPGRLELTGAGGGQLVPPEVLDRKVQAITGVRWQRHGWAVAREEGYQSLGRWDGTEDAFLVQREELKTLYGGVDGTTDGVKVRQRLPGTLTAAIVERMALAVSCEAVARELSSPPDLRRLLPLVEAEDVPTGDAADSGQAVIVEQLRALRARVLGERLPADDAEIVAMYELLSEVRAAGLADIARGAASVALDRPCAADLDLGTVTPTPGGIVADPQFTVRAWQAVVAFLLMDPDFVLEP